MDDVVVDITSEAKQHRREERRAALVNAVRAVRKVEFLCGDPAALLHLESALLSLRWCGALCNEASAVEAEIRAGRR